MSPSTNPEDFFPGLDIPLLKAHAKRWLNKYSEAPIERILLYKFSSPLRGAIADMEGQNFKYLPHVYTIVFEIAAINKTLEMSHAELMEYDRLVIKAQNPEIDENGRIIVEAPPEPYSRLLAATDLNSRFPFEFRYQHFIDEDFREVYTHPITDMDSHRKDWFFCLKFKNTELDANIRVDETPVVLLKAGAEAKAIQSLKKERFPNIVAEIKTGPHIKWVDIGITFLGNEEILIQYGEAHTERKFNQAGFENRKNGKPIQSWKIFFEATRRTKGKLPYTFETRKKIEKITQTLNNKLCELFPDIPGKAFSISKEENIYEPAFQINPNI